MNRFSYFMCTGFLTVAAAAQAGIPIVEEKECHVGGEKFAVTQTASCTSFGGSQDFLLKAQTSCDFVTKLAQCPTNKLPLYKEFDADEIRKLESFVTTEKYKSLQSRSRYMIAHEVEKFLQGGEEANGLGFHMLFGGLQFDRENTLSDPEYLAAVNFAGTKELEKEATGDTPYIQLVMSFLDYFNGKFAEATTRLGSVKVDEQAKKNKLIPAYIARLSECIKSSDSKKCASTDRVMPREVK